MSTTKLADGTKLHWVERPAATSSSPPFIFQHGMGGDVAQPASYVDGAPSPRLLCIDARGHGLSDDVSPADASFDRFADDVIEVADALGLERFVMGGISLGAGTALNLVLRYPDRITALVLCRPAWIDAPQETYNRDAYREIADLLETAGAEAGVEAFTSSDRYRDVLAASPAAAASLVGQFTRPGAVRNSAVLRAFPADQPSPDAQAWTRIEVPTLVIGHHDDPFHPFAIAAVYAAAIPGARLVTVASKDADAEQFRLGIRSAISAFLQPEAAADR